MTWQSATEAAGMTETGGIPDWLTQGLVTVAAALVIAAILTGAKAIWRTHRLVADIVEDWPEMRRQLAEVNEAVNQSTTGPLTQRVDEVVATVDRIETRLTQTLTFPEVAAVAKMLHPDVDADDLIEAVAFGDHLDLSLDQAREVAREVARRRAEMTGPDNPEVHP